MLRKLTFRTILFLTAAALVVHGNTNLTPARNSIDDSPAGTVQPVPHSDTFESSELQLLLRR